MNDVNAQQLLIAGGPAMVPIILCSIAAATIMFQKYADLKNLQISLPNLKNEVFGLIRENKIKAAISSCDRNPSTLSRVLKSGLMQFGNSRDEIKDVIHTAISLEIPKLEKGLTPLITIANITPLFGILGTVLGMAAVFQMISIRTAGMAPVTISDLSGGIWQALLSTIAGLIVTIPSFVAYNYFVTQVTQNINDLEQTGEELTHLLTRLTENSSHSSSSGQTINAE